MPRGRLDAVLDVPRELARRALRAVERRRSRPVVLCGQVRAPARRATRRTAAALGTDETRRPRRRNARRIRPLPVPVAHETTGDAAFRRALPSTLPSRLFRRLR